MTGDRVTEWQGLDVTPGLSGTKACAFLSLLPFR